MRTQRSGLFRRRDGSERLWFTPSDIEATMEAELHRLGKFPSCERPAVDVEGFIQELGVRMDQYAELEPAVLGQTEFYTDGPPKICINRDLTGALDDDQTAQGTRGRWRATLAHEASHVVLHRVLFEVNATQDDLFQFADSAAPQRLMRCLKGNVLFRGGTSDWKEVQANMAMAALLMPKSVFGSLATQAVKENGLQAEALVAGSPGVGKLAAQLSILFDVSKQAAGIRLETLRIASPARQPWLGPEFN